MPKGKKTPKTIEADRKTIESDRLTKDEKSTVFKIWMELDDERKVSLGPHVDLQENKRILFEAIQAKEPELMAKFSKNAKYKTPMYNYFSTNIWRWTR